MSATWGVVVAVGIATIVIKAAGPVLLGGRQLPPRVLRLAAHLAPALLAALVAVGTFGSARALTLDARAGGTAVAVVALALRAPVLLVVLLAAVTTAALRAFA